jgi:Domain of unknown function (DUF3806)
MADGHIPLHPDDQDRLVAARDWIKGHYVNDPEGSYAPLEGKLHVVGTILESGWIAADETWKLQALGVAFGDGLAQELMLDWVTVEDEFGRDPALNWPGTSIYSYPLTTISKRVERGESVDVRQLFDSACKLLSEMAYSGRYT